MPPLISYLQEILRLWSSLPAPLDEYPYQNVDFSDEDYDFVDKIFEFDIFVGILVPFKINDGYIDEVKQAFKYAKRGPKPLKDTYDYFLRRIISELPYTEAEVWVPLSTNKKRWKQVSGTYFTPLDRDTYYEEVKLASQGKKEIALAKAWRSLEPEEFITYLKTLVDKKEIDPSDSLRVLRNARIRAEEEGYSYFEAVVKKEIQKV